MSVHTQPRWVSSIAKWEECLVSLVGSLKSDDPDSAMFPGCFGSHGKGDLHTDGEFQLHPFQLCECGQVMNLS